MDCPACGDANRPEARFCKNCGASLAESPRCPDCGAEYLAGQRFCDDCGRQLSPEAPRAGGPPEPRSQIPEHLAAKIRAGAGALEGERKQVTVLFADVVGSMELASGIDPEAWRAIMERLFSLSCGAVHRYEGTVDKFTGDGAMAIFGAPIAHEDHARRACYAALELQESLAAYAEELRSEQGLALSLRVGLNSGEVVVGAIGADSEMDYTAIGHTVGLAQRAEQLAAPGKIYLTEHTAALVKGYLELIDRGLVEPKGAGGPLRIHELAGRSEGAGRAQPLRRRGLSRFVGREAELQILESAREQALSGQGQVVGVVGEAGVGKSRLCYEFAERCRGRGMPVYHVAAQAHAKSVPLAPVLQLLRDFFGIGEQDPDQLARERIEEAVGALEDLGLREELPLLFEFLAVADPERPAERMDPEARQRRLLALLRRLARAQSAQQPVLMVFEDLHWLDAASEAYLANHVEALLGTQSMALVNFRPDYQAQWMSRSYYRQIALSPLGAEASERLLAELLGDDSSLEGLAGLIAERSEGNPFFIEEIVRSLAEQESLLGGRGAYRLVGAIEQITVPATVQAVLAARIDRLSEREKAVLGAAAVIGREFSQPILEQVAEPAAGELEEALGELASAEFVYLHELTPEPVYLFKHALSQQVAYDSQLGERRRALHAKAAEAIVAGNPERLEERAALVARHWEAAGYQLEAARWFARAAAWAGTGDPAAAFSHWQRVRELADELPESEESAGLGLAARTYLLAFGWRLGMGHEEAEALFAEGERVAERTEDVRWRALLLGGYGFFRAIDGELGEAAAVARRAIALAEQYADPGLYVVVSSQALHPLALSGEIRESVAVADRAIELAGGDPSVGAGLGVGCPYANCIGYRGFDLATVGELDESGREIARSREIAGEQGDAELVGWTHLYSCWQGYLLGEAGTALAHAQRTVEITERIGDSFARSWAWFSLGMAEVMRGRWKTAVEALDRSRQIYRELHGAVEAEPWRLAFLAEAHLGLGDNGRAEGAAAEGVAVARSQGNVFGELVASLAQARVLLGAEGFDARIEIEAALANATELIRRMGAKAFEPQVHVERAELARQDGDETSWREELSEARRLFTAIGASGHVERVARELAVSAS